MQSVILHIILFECFIEVLTCKLFSLCSFEGVSSTLGTFVPWTRKLTHFHTLMFTLSYNGHTCVTGTVMNISTTVTISPHFKWSMVFDNVWWKWHFTHCWSLQMTCREKKNKITWSLNKNSFHKNGHDLANLKQGNKWIQHCHTLTKTN